MDASQLGAVVTKSQRVTRRDSGQRTQLPRAAAMRHERRESMVSLQRTVAEKTSRATATSEKNAKPQYEKVGGACTLTRNHATGCSPQM